MVRLKGVLLGICKIVAFHFIKLVGMKTKKIVLENVTDNLEVNGIQLLEEKRILLSKAFRNPSRGMVRSETRKGDML